MERRGEEETKPACFSSPSARLFSLLSPPAPRNILYYDAARVRARFLVETPKAGKARERKIFSFSRAVTA